MIIFQYSHPTSPKFFKACGKTQPPPSKPSFPHFSSKIKPPSFVPTNHHLNLSSPKSFPTLPLLKSDPIPLETNRAEVTRKRDHKEETGPDSERNFETLGRFVKPSYYSKIVSQIYNNSIWEWTPFSMLQLTHLCECVFFLMKHNISRTTLEIGFCKHLCIFWDWGLLE